MDGFLGTLDAPIYFRNHRDPNHPEGYLMLAPYSDFPTPYGYSREVARTLPDIDRLQKILCEQERQAFERDHIYDQVLVGQKQREITDRLRQRMVSSSTSPYDRDIIAAYLELKEEKREKHAQRFRERNMYLYAREHDSHGRSPDAERVDHVDVK
jgi:hypothetical protein